MAEHIRVHVVRRERTVCHECQHPRQVDHERHMYVTDTRDADKLRGYPIVRALVEGPEGDLLTYVVDQVLWPGLVETGAGDDALLINGRTKCGGELLGGNIVYGLPKPAREVADLPTVERVNWENTVDWQAVGLGPQVKP